MIGLDTSLFAFAVLMASVDSMKSAEKLISAVPRPNLFPFLLLDSTEEGVLPHFFGMNALYCRALFLKALQHFAAKSYRHHPPLLFMVQCGGLKVPHFTIRGGRIESTLLRTSSVVRK